MSFWKSAVASVASGNILAAHCRRWIGADVSPNMLTFAAERLQGFSNVEFVELSGNDLRPIADSSIDLVYCTVVFMHLEGWDRYGYVEEAFRVLRPGGKLYVDNVNLCSDAGWSIFETHRKFPVSERPDHITVCSTPQELQEYLRRAGFESNRNKTGRRTSLRLGTQTDLLTANSRRTGGVAIGSSRAAQTARDLAVEVHVFEKKCGVARITRRP